MGSIPGLGRSHEGGNGNPLQYSCLGNPMDRSIWRAAVHGATKNCKWLSNWFGSWNSNTLATWCEELTHLKRPWCWQGLGAGGEGDDRGWDGCMASLTQLTWVWVNSGSWWWTRRPGVLQSVASQRVRLNWATELIVWATVHTNPHTHTHDSFRWRGKGLSHTVFSNHICQMPSISRQSSLLTLLPLWWCATTESRSWSLILSSHSGNSLMSLTSVITSILLTPKSKS